MTIAQRSGRTERVAAQINCHPGCVRREIWSTIRDIPPCRRKKAACSCLNLRPEQCAAIRKAGNGFALSCGCPRRYVGPLQSGYFLTAGSCCETGRGRAADWELPGCIQAAKAGESAPPGSGFMAGWGCFWWHLARSAPSKGHGTHAIGLSALHSGHALSPIHRRVGAGDSAQTVRMVRLEVDFSCPSRCKDCQIVLRSRLAQHPPVVQHVGERVAHEAIECTCHQPTIGRANRIQPGCDGCRVKHRTLIVMRKMTYIGFRPYIGKYRT